MLVEYILGISATLFIFFKYFYNTMLRHALKLRLLYRTSLRAMVHNVFQMRDFWPSGASLCGRIELVVEEKL